MADRHRMRRIAGVIATMAVALGGNTALALPAAAAITAPSPVDVFALHSDSESTHTIYLNFQGHDVTGTRWNAPAPGGTGQADIHVPPIDFDGDDGAWSSDEQAFIYEVWREVSEYYAIFDVDVTTAQPDNSALDRDSASDDSYGATVLFTADEGVRSVLVDTAGSEVFTGRSYPQSFGDADSDPSWVFLHVLNFDPRTVAKVAAREIGFRLGLAGGPSQVGSPSASVWGSIMENQQAPLYQFTEGDSNDSDPGGELAHIAAGQDDQNSGLPFRSDDYGDTIADAHDLDIKPQYSITGLIGKHVDEASGSISQDVDVFRVPHECMDNLTASATNSGLGSALDILVEILDGDGDVVASDNPDPAVAPNSPARITGLNASATLEAPSTGDYYIRVSGTGYGDPANGGYTDYGSIGSYTLDVTGCPTPTLVTVTETVPVSTTVTRTVTVTDSATVTAQAAAVTVTDTVPADPGTVTVTTTVTASDDAPTGGELSSPAAVVADNAGGTTAQSPPPRGLRHAGGNAVADADADQAGAAGGAADQRMAHTGPPSWLPSLIGYGLLLLAAGVGMTMVAVRRPYRGGHSG